MIMRSTHTSGRKYTGLDATKQRTKMAAAAAATTTCLVFPNDIYTTGIE